MDMCRVTCIVQCLRALHGCTVHVILYCWVYTVYVWLSTAMGMEDEQHLIWLLHAQFLRPCLTPHMTGESGSLDMWLFLVHEYSLYFCYEFCCLHIYPVYFHHIYIYIYIYAIYYIYSNTASASKSALRIVKSKSFLINKLNQLSHYGIVKSFKLTISRITSLQLHD